jgi:hypothetical protein
MKDAEIHALVNFRHDIKAQAGEIPHGVMFEENLDEI